LNATGWNTGGGSRRTGTEYADFIAARSDLGPAHGFEPVEVPDFLFGFQKSLLEWAVRRGRAAIYADCGLGKTPRQYASAFWDDVRLGRVLRFKEARDAEDERHMHPLQLDVIERCLTLWSNPGEVVLTPFLGVGSEAFGAARMGRKAVGIELEPAYFRRAVENLKNVDVPDQQSAAFGPDLFGDDDGQEL
jgi:hypothetical protein